jgi:hypothetical protein
MRTKIVAFVVLISLVLLASSVNAEHPHWLTTPGHVNCNIASGQTFIANLLHGGYHKFHSLVHIGIPGLKAFANPKNPVEVGKISLNPPAECV